MMRRLLSLQYGMEPIGAIRAAGVETMLVLLPFLLAAAALAIVGSVAQGGVVLKPFELKFSQLNPLEGLKRIFSHKGLVELGKNLLKLGVGGYVTTSRSATRSPSCRPSSSSSSARPSASPGAGRQGDPDGLLLLLRHLGPGLLHPAVAARAVPDDDQDRGQGRVQGNRGEPAGQGAAPQPDEGPGPQEDDAGRPEGDRRHHQPDPPGRRPEVRREEHGRPEDRREGRRSRRREDPGDRPP